MATRTQLKTTCLILLDLSFIDDFEIKRTFFLKKKETKDPIRDFKSVEDSDRPTDLHAATVKKRFLIELQIPSVI